MLERIPFEAQKLAHSLFVRDGFDPGRFPPCLLSIASFSAMHPRCSEGFALTAAPRTRGLCLLSPLLGVSGREATSTEGTT